MKNLLFTLIAGFLIAGCLPTPPDIDNDEGKKTFSPEQQQIQTLKLTDSANRAIGGADITLTKLVNEPATSETSLQSSAITTTVQTDEDGYLQINALTPGQYQLSASVLGIETTLIIDIKDDNASNAGMLMLPISIYENSEGELAATNLQDEGIFININGVIYDKDRVLSNAQVEISGGTDTNGAITTVITDNEGRFFISANVSSDKLAAMQNATIRIFKPGYVTVLLEAQDLTVASSIIGMNILLIQDNADIPLVYQESFETLNEGAVCGAWAAMPFSPNNDWLNWPYMEEPAESNPEETTETPDPIVLTNLWHQHTSDSVIQNQAYVTNAVLLAPNDTSAGYIPQPQSQAACWYGSAQPSGVSQGNFLGEANPEQIDLNGGKSLIRNAGAIVSPTIDLTDETAPLSLSFKTWWEIESVNPNENGFDLMIIQYSINEGQSWQSLARLNPLSDPAESSESTREPIPYSNLGYNKAPNWVWLEPISLDALAGHQAQLRFIFSTNDDLYNGFRGWLVDDIRIERKVGTFPLYIEPNFYIVRTSVSEPSDDDIINISATIIVKPEHQASGAYAQLVHADEEGTVTVLDTQAITDIEELVRLNGTINASPSEENTFFIRLFDSEDTLIEAQMVYDMVGIQEPS